MAKGSDLDRVTAIVLREMRSPLIVLVAVYALGVGVMMLIPGIDDEPMSAFHAFYFMTYTATTTGFGELPREFSDPQRLWATICLYMSVISWIYGIGTIIRLVQNPHFTLAIAQAQFARAVARINDPFIIICGFGDTGSLLARGLSDRRMNAVIIDSDVERIKALAMRDYSLPMPGLQGDASVPKNLSDAGIARPECKAVVLLTGNEDINLKIAVMVRLLNPAADVVCRTTSHAHDEELKGLGSVVLVDPFMSWARELGLALHLPELHTLDEWLVGAHGVTLGRLISYPRGTWIVCGFGRLGRSLHEALERRDVRTVVIDPLVDADSGITHHVTGLATRANLLAAGVGEASGVVAATASDSDNLAVLLTARALNPDVHLIVRQNRHENELAFNAASADLIMQPSLVTARRLLLQLISPLVQELLDHLERHPGFLRDQLFPRLRAAVPATNPALWSVSIDAAQAAGVHAYLDAGGRVRLGDLVRDPRDRARTLACVPLVARRGAERRILPTLDMELRAGDELLLCTAREDEHKMRSALANPYTVEYLATGLAPARGIAFKRLARRGA
jgi:Trk K+ transport system NAD-binding subunit